MMKLQSLRAKFLIGSLGLVVLLGLGVIILARTTLTDKIEMQLQKRGLYIARSFAQEAVTPILTQNVTSLRLLCLDHKAAENDIKYLFIEGPDGNIIAHTFGDTFPVALTNANKLPFGQRYSIRSLATEQGSVFDIAVPILKGRLGTVRLGMSSEPVREGIAAIIRDMVWIIAVVLALGGIIAVLFTRRIMQPLAEFSDAAKTVGSGDLTRRVSVSTHDEIGRLAETFNKMVDDLLKSTVSRDQLERSVEARTAELSEANTRLRTEIEEHSRIEGELKEINAKFKTLIEAMPDVVFFKDCRYRYMMVNKAFEELLGVKQEMVVGKTDDDIMPPELAAGCRKSDEELVHGRKSQYAEDTIIGENGLNIFLESVKTPIYDSQGNLMGIVGVSRDVTERKRSAKMIENLNRRNEAILMSAGEGICGIDLDGIITFANPAAARIAGWTVDELIGESQHELFHHSLWDGTPHPPENCRVHASMREGIVHRVADEVFWKKDGTSFPVEYVSTPIKADGKIVGAVIVFSDITERKKIENALLAVTLREHEEKARTEAIVSAIGDNISIHDREFKIIYQNRPNKETTGEHVGEYCYSAYHGRDSICEDCHLAETFKDGDVWTVEKKLNTKDGTRFVEVTSSPLKNATGKIIAGVELFRDITPRKNSEEALRSNEERLARAQEIAHVGDWEWDIATGAVHWSNELYRIYGYQPHEIAPDYALVVEAMHPDSREKFLQAIDSALKDRQPFEMDYTFFKKDGSTAILHAIGRVTRDADRKPERMLGIVQDITEQKEAEQALRLSRERLSKAQKMAHVGNWEKNLVTGHLFWSEEIYRIYGVDPAAYSPTSEAFKKAMHPDDLEPFLKALNAAIYERNFLDMEYRLIRPDGTVRTVHTLSDVTYGPNGEPLLHSGTIQDITERKQAEEALQESEEKYRLLVETANSVILTWDISGKILFMNEYGQRFFGFSEDELIGRNVVDTIVPRTESSGRDLALLMEQIQKGPDAYKDNENENITKDGRRVWIRWSNKAIMDERGGLIGILSIGHDITDRKHAEEALNEANQTLGAMIRYSPLAIICIDTDSNVLIWNPAAERIFGWKEDEVLGRKNPIVPEGKGEEYQLLVDSVRDGEPYLARELVRKRKDGTLLHLAVSSAAIHDTEGKTVASFALFQDITERKLAGDEINKTNAQLRTLINTIPDMVMFKDTVGRHVIVNRAVEEMTGHRAVDIVGRAVEDLMPPGPAEACRRSDEEAMKRNVPTRAEESVVREDGKETYLDIVKAPMIDAENKVIGLVAIGRDITERYRMEEALRNSEANYRSLLEQASDGIAVIDREGHYIDVNSRMCEMLGYSRNEFLKLSITDVVAPGEMSTTSPSKLPEILAGKTVLNERLMQRKDGTTFPMEISAKMLPDGRLCGIHRDITDRRQAEEALRISEERLSKAQKIAHVGNWEWNLATNTIYWSEEVYRIFGYDPVQYVPTFDLVGKSMYPEDRKANRKAIDAAIKDRKPLDNFYRITRDDGQVRTLHTIGELLCDPSGKAVMMMGTIQDVTEQKQVEEALRKAHDELDILVKERTAELTMVNDQLRSLFTYIQDMREKERAVIAREIHDELGQALTALKIDLSWLSRRMPSEKKPLLEKIRSMSELIEATIEAVKRISTELRPGILDHLGLPAAIEWQAGEFQKRTGIHCNLRLEPEDLELDRERSTTLFRILQETLTNIARHAKAKKVSIALEEEFDEVVLRVEDNGKGILETHVSDPKSLGLIGMRERVHFWGGQLDIRGTRNKGTAVTVRIPRESKGGTA